MLLFIHWIASFWEIIDGKNTTWPWRSCLVFSRLHTFLLLLRTWSSGCWPLATVLIAFVIIYITLTLGPPASSVCRHNLQACIQLCSKLGLCLHRNKLEDPSTHWAQSCYRSGFPLKRESDTLPCWVPYWSPPPMRASCPPPPPRLERLPIAWVTY